MPHFFIKSDQITGDIVEISDKDNYQHIAKSLRIKSGEKLLLIDENQIQYETVVSEVTNSKVFAKVSKSYKSEKFLDFDLFLAQAPLRSDAQNYIIEKATELGVTGIYPICTHNCALNKSVIEKKIPKWQKIMCESSKQCERALVPVMYPPANLKNLIESDSFDKVIAFCERITTKTIREALKGDPISKGDRILVIVGPEGGFADDEFEMFKDLKVEMLTLGKLILRAETAVVTALGNIIYEYENSEK